MHMKKGVNDALNFINKFVGSLLAVLVGAALTANAKLGSVIATTENLTTTVAEIHGNVQRHAIDLAVLKTQNRTILNEQSEIKENGKITREVQVNRTKSIECIDQISDVLGCSIPKAHGELYK